MKFEELSKEETSKVELEILRNGLNLDHLESL